MAAEQIALFVAAGLLLNLIPGPDVLFIVRQAFRGGARPGVVAALGISAGCGVHMLAAALGLGALLAASATAFGVLKWAGAVWLIWLGFSMLRASFRSNLELIAIKDQLTLDRGEKSLKNVFWKAVGTNALNPKVALFFLAFVPQFIAPQVTHKALAFLALGALFTFNSFWINAGWALVAASARARLGGALGPRLASATRWLDRAAGGLFIGFGLRLALTESSAT